MGDPLVFIRKQAEAIRSQVDALIASLDTIQAQGDEPELPEIEEVPAKPATFKGKGSDNGG